MSEQRKMSGFRYRSGGPYVVRTQTEATASGKCVRVHVYRCAGEGVGSTRVTVVRDWAPTEKEALAKARKAIRDRRERIADHIEALEREHADADEWIRAGSKLSEPSDSID